MRKASALLAIVLSFVACTTVRPAEEPAVPIGVPMRGRVVYPDGSPAAGVKVVATTACDQATVNFVDEALSSADGSFVIPSFDPTCGKVRFTAEKREAFWLRTGTDPFYPRPNGTAPEVSVTGDVPPDPVTIQLDLRGGELELRVWDRSSGAYVRAGLDIDCPGAWCGAMSTATGNRGEADTVFLPPRTYRVALNWYLCGSRTYFPETEPSITIDVIEGQLRTALLKVDVTAIPARPSYDNPEGRICRF